MAEIDPVDDLPQVPVDWANHVIYGGVGGLIVFLVASFVDLDAPAAAATCSVLMVATVKKIFDYFEEGEPIWMCVGKALATAVWPATFMLVGHAA